MRDEKYLDLVNKALFSFQMVEESLKLCIGLSYEIIAASTPSGLAFKFSKDSIYNAPLGRLISMFSNISNNETLIEDLKKVVKWRNFCAHNAYAHEFMTRASKSSFSHHTSDDLAKIAMASNDLVSLLGEEIKKLLTIHKNVVGENMETGFCSAA